MSPEQKPPRVVVIGAGPAGLTAARELVRSGVAPVVFETDCQVGGISRTVEREGWRFDIGGHRFFTKVPRVQAFWQEILPPEEFPTRNRLSRIYYGGKFFDYPIKPLDALSKLGPFEAFRCLLSYVTTRVFPPKDQTDFESWVAARFGWRLYRIFFKTYTEKVWGVPATAIRSDWAAQRIKGLSLPAAIFNALRSSVVQTKHPSLIDRFQYPLLGPGMMWERTADLVCEGLGEIRFGSRVVTLSRGDAGVESVEADVDGIRTVLAADHVISSMPLGDLVIAMSPQAPDAVLEAAKGLTHRDFLTVALVGPESFGFPDNWIYVHDPSVKLGRVQNFGAWSPEMVKEGKTCLGLEYFVFEGDELWGMRDEDLIAFATEEITRIGLIPSDFVEDGYVVRVPRAYPVYDSGYAERVSLIREWLEREVPNVHPVGRNGMHRYNNQDHSMLTAMLAVENVQGASHDVWSVNVDAEYHEAGRYGATPREAGSGTATDGTGRDVPQMLGGSDAADLDSTSRRTPSGLLVELSLRSEMFRNLCRFVFRSLLDTRRTVRSLIRPFSSEELLARPVVERLQWKLYHLAFNLSTLKWLRQVHFRIRDVSSRNRRTVVPLEQLLVGGWNGMSASHFAEASGFLLDPSTPLAASAQVDLLRRYESEGESIYEAKRLGETPYFDRIRAAAEISGHHRGARTDEELLQVAREFIDRYRGKPVPYRPGRTTGAALARVRRVDRSDRYEIRDGHHRLAIEFMRGATDAEVVLERPRSVTPAQRLLRKMSWLDGQVRLYQPVPLPEVATWPLMRSCTDRLSMMLDFLDQHGLDGAAREHSSYLDVGACYGWFVAQMKERGFDSQGIESDPLSRDLAGLVYGLDLDRITIGDAVGLLCDGSRRYDVVSCFSVLHHFVLGRGSCSASELVALLDKVTDKVLFLDTGQAHESWFRYVLPEWSTEYARGWILDHTSFSEVLVLGTDQDGVGRFEGKYGRALFRVYQVNESVAGNPDGDTAGVGRVPARPIHQLMATLRRRKGEEVAFVASNALVNVANFGFFVASARLFSPSSYGAISALLSVVTAVNPPLNAIQAGVVHATVTALRSDQQPSPRRTALAFALAGVGASAAIAAASPLFERLFVLSSVVPVLVLALWFTPSVVNSALCGSLMGHFRFRAVAEANVIGASTRIALVLVFGACGHLFGLAGPILATSLGVSVTAAWVFLAVRTEPQWRSENSLEVHFGHTFWAFVSLGGFAALTAVDVVLARHLLPVAVAGQYAAASTAAKIALYLSVAVPIVAYPRFAARAAAGSDGRRELTVALELVVTLGLVAGGVMAVLPRPVIDLLFGSHYASAAATLQILAPEGALMGAVGLFTYFHVALRSAYSFAPWAGVATVSSVMVAGHLSSRDLALLMLVVSAVVALVMGLPPFVGKWMDQRPQSRGLQTEDRVAPRGLAAQ